MKKLWLIMGCVIVISAFAAGYATMQQTARKEKETLAADVPFVTAIRDRELNGAIGYEWIDASSEEIKIGRFDAILFVKHDGENLYLGLEIATGERFDSLELYAAFDTNRNGDFFDQGDDILIITLEKGDFVKSEDIDYFYPETYQFALDRDFSGTNNAIGVISVDTILLEDNVVYTAEFKKSLTGDAGMDVELRPGDEVDMVIGVIGEASPKDEQVSKPIRMWLKKIKAGAAYIGKIFYGDFSDEKGKKDGKIDIKIPRTPEEGGTIKIDPGKYKTKVAKLEDFDGDDKKDEAYWLDNVDKDKAKEILVDFDGDGIPDVILDEDKNGKFVFNKKKYKVWSFGYKTERMVWHVMKGTIEGWIASAPAGVPIVIILIEGKEKKELELGKARDNGSFDLSTRVKIKVKGKEEEKKLELYKYNYKRTVLEGGKIHIVFEK